MYSILSTLEKKTIFLNDHEDDQEQINEIIPQIYRK